MPERPPPVHAKRTGRTLRPQFVSWWQSVVDRFRFASGSFNYQMALGALNYPIFLRVLFRFLRRFRPIGIILGSYYVARHDHVSEVLRRSGDFTVHDALAPGMPWGPFLLTTDWPDIHDRDRRMLRSFVERGDTQRIADIVRARCSSALDSVPSGDGSLRIDFAAQYAEPAVIAIIEAYFGVRPLNGSAADMAAALRLLSSNIMAQPPPGSAMAAATDQAITDLTLHIECEVCRTALRAASGDIAPGPSNTVLERMALRLASSNSTNGFDEDWIRRFLTGLLATAAGTMVRAASHTLDRLLADEGAMKQTCDAARLLTDDIANGTSHMPTPAPGAGTQHQIDSGSRGDFEQLLLEALRFRPMLPLLVRHCPREVILGEGTTFERTVRGGSPVKIGLISGMFDPMAFEEPGRFMDNRDGKRDGSAYLHFGFGPRYCFGTFVARTVISELLRELLVRGTPQRVPGRNGRPVYEAAAVKHLIVSIPSGGRG